MEIKPCPFCGSSATLIHRIFNDYIACDNYKCGCIFQGDYLHTGNVVIKRWNSRNVNKEATE